MFSYQFSKGIGASICLAKAMIYLNLNNLEPQGIQSNNQLWSTEEGQNKNIIYLFPLPPKKGKQIKWVTHTFVDRWGG